jgi:hypothetical protein
MCLLISTRRFMIRNHSNEIILLIKIIISRNDKYTTPLNAILIKIFTSIKGKDFV